VVLRVSSYQTGQVNDSLREIVGFPAGMVEAHVPNFLFLSLRSWILLVLNFLLWVLPNRKLVASQIFFHNGD